MKVEIVSDILERRKSGKINRVIFCMSGRQFSCLIFPYLSGLRCRYVFSAE